MHQHDKARKPTGDDAPGILITKVRQYNVMVAVMFGGRREALNRALATAGGVAPGEHALDVGSGPGRFARTLGRRVGPDGRVTGVDPSEPMVEHARRRVGDRMPHVDFRLSAAQSLELPDDSFDVVTSTFVVHHIPPESRTAAFAQMYRVLRPGGRLLLADAYPTGRVAQGLTRLLQRRTPKRLVGVEGPGEQHRAEAFADTDVRQYVDALREVGFADPRVADLKPWTRFVLAAKPG